MSAPSDNLIEGNQIGVDAAKGPRRFGNQGFGVHMYGGATNYPVGGTISAASNVISGNEGIGAAISDSGTTGNVFEGDFIGTNATGDTLLGNKGGGVYIYGGGTTRARSPAAPSPTTWPA